MVDPETPRYDAVRIARDIDRRDAITGRPPDAERSESTDIPIGQRRDREQA
jgi:hypothetical protein